MTLCADVSGDLPMCVSQLSTSAVRIRTMPPLPNVPNVLKADLAWSLPGAPLINTRNFFRYSGGPPTSTDATALAADIYSAMSGHATLWSDDVNFTNVQ